MKNAILNFPKQFSWNPEVVGSIGRVAPSKYILVGMGGSHLAADLMSITHPRVSFTVHKNYSLPRLSTEELRNSLIILSSYSGNTEEVVHAFEEVQKRAMKCAIITTGGKLLELAQRHNIPYVQLPDISVQPRMATGFSIKALLKIMNDDDALSELRELGTILHAEDFEENGKRIAQTIEGCVPIIYASETNFPIAHNWKIKFNETGKIPAFSNMVPELNHNEMTSFSNPRFAKQFCFIVLKDEMDHPRIVKRIEILKTLLTEKGASVYDIDISHDNVWYKIFSTLLLADWTAYHTAQNLGHDPTEVPMVEDFKKLLN
ncbi:MAG: bifunctional phosphoglucose/phosphomannose isomerase [Parcubacteria group bacterium]|nr:bifunctional phosphoglucose/phosphomannose isomerase [Parcubacteria group bacterium]